MKRPPIVIATIILFGVFVILGSLAAMKVFPLGFGKFVVALMTPVLFLIGWLGILKRRSWANLYGSIIILLNASIMVLVAFPIITERGLSNSLGLTVSVIAVLLFELWWAYRLGFGKASKKYFQSNVDI